MKSSLREPIPPSCAVSPFTIVYHDLTIESPQSKRAYQTQFKKWEFPQKQNPAFKNPVLVARTKELWEQNHSQKVMLQILNEEGFGLKDRELMRVRVKNRWLMRLPNGQASTYKARQPSAEEQALAEVERAFLQGNGAGLEHGAESPATPGVGHTSLGAKKSATDEVALSPEVVAKRRERFERLRAESDEKWASRKRRRRTRGWAGLPADPPQAPRYPSETTIDESKRFLNLNTTGYQELRDQFQRICEEDGIIKKTLAGPERWQAAKERLISESPTLQVVFVQGRTTASEAERTQALDVVCMDVTKRLRTLQSRMTIAEAKRALELNPQESRELRQLFYDILQRDHFTSKMQAGEDHWEGLKRQWVSESPRLQRSLASGPNDPQYSLKEKAIECLSRDTMKRLRDEQTRLDPSRKKLERPVYEVGLSNDLVVSKSNPSYISPDTGISTLASQALASAPDISNEAENYTSLQLDPALLQAANDPSLTAEQHRGANQTPLPNHLDPRMQNPNYPSSNSPSDSVPIYFRHHHLSEIQDPPKMWLSRLSTRTIEELKQQATANRPNCAVEHLEGITGSGMNEMAYRIDMDDELDAYLEHVLPGGGKAVFSVLMERL